MNPQEPYQQNPDQQPPQPQYGQSQQQYQQPYYGQPQYPPQPMAPPPAAPTPGAAILWFCSPAIAIGTGILLSIFSRAFGYSDVSRQVFNILSILCGLAFVILIVLGPVMGIVIISRNKK